MNRNIKLSWVFRDSRQNWLFTVLDSVRDELKQNIEMNKTLFNIKDVEKMYNSIFYPKVLIDQNSLAIQYQDEMLDELQKTIATSFENFDLNLAVQDINVHAKQTVSYARFSNTILKAENSLRAIQQAIANNLGTVSQINNLKNIEQQLQSIINNAMTVKQHFEQEYANKGIERHYYKKGDIGSLAVQLLTELEAFNMATYNGQNISKTELGDIFEKYLAIGSKNFYDTTINDMYNTITGYITGKHLVQRGTYKQKPLSKVTYNVDINELGITQGKAKKLGFKVEKDGCTITYSYNPGQEKQAKMDVNIDYQMASRPNIVNSLRVSAKNWGGGKTRSLGMTSIDAALNRSVGLNIAEYYKMAMLNPKLDQREVGKKVAHIAKYAGHDLARLALASDIVMGLNQGEAGMANVLVIDTGTEIKVINISNLILKRDNLINCLKGYENKTIISKAGSAYKAIEKVKINRSKAYLAFFTSTLNKMKVSYTLPYNLNTI